MHHLDSLLSNFRPNRFKYHQNACLRLFSLFSLQFQIVSNNLRMHALDISFSKKISAVPNRLKYRQNACFRDIVFIFFLPYFFAWRVCITLKRNVFCSASAAKYKIVSLKYALKCPRMQLRRYRMSIFSEGACPRTP